MSAAQSKTERLYTVLKAPIVSEKSTMVADKIGRASCRERVFRAV